MGSTFKVRLPLVSAPAASEAEHPKTYAPLPGTGTRNILVVDDNVDAADTLREYGYTVTVAYSAAEGMKLFSRTRLDHGILDIGLPGMSGYQLADLMRKSGCNTQLRYIALTGYGQELDKERSALANFSAHLVKPVDGSEIVSLL